MICVVADHATRSWAFASCLYALWFIRDILLVFCMYLMTYYVGSVVVVAFLLFPSFFLSFHETLACAKVTVKMTFYSVMHLTNKLNKSSVQLGAWVCSAGGLFPSPSWQAVLTCYKAPSYSINHLVSGSSDFAVLHPTPPLCPT